MTFGLNHYVPALKLKTGEKDALAMLLPATKQRITPILQVVERVGTKSIDDHIETAFKKIQPAVSGLSRFFIDPVEIKSDGAAAAQAVFEKCQSLGVPFTPVAGLSRAPDLTAAAMQATGRTGLAVRLTREDFEKGRLAEFSAYLTTHSIAATDTDVILDIGEVEDMIADGIAALAESFMASLPQLSQWRTLTLLSSAFPESMKHVDRDSHAYVDRAEWQAWCDHLRKAGPSVPRPPTFGDWGIQHPGGVEHFDPLKMQASAAIRYATDSKWLLIKGRGTKKASPGKQMPGLAGQLTTGAHKKAFCGAHHCAACALIVAAANGAPKLGSPTKWRQIGTAHHITTTVEAIQKLPAP
jgi:hypothetical protein